VREIARLKSELATCQTTNKINLELAAAMRKEIAEFHRQIGMQEALLQSNRRQIAMLETVITEFKKQLGAQDVRVVQLHSNAAENEPRLQALNHFLLALEGISREQSQVEEKQRKYAD
jgi:chromosome segregation ATPase